VGAPVQQVCPVGTTRTPVSLVHRPHEVQGRGACAALRTIGRQSQEQCERLFSYTLLRVASIWLR